MHPRLPISFVTLLVVFSHAAAQPTLPKPMADSLWAAWQDQTLPDTVRLSALSDYAWDGYLFSQPDSTYHYARLAFDFAQSRGLKARMAYALHAQSMSWFMKGNYIKAMEHSQRAVDLAGMIGDDRATVICLGGMANILSYRGDYSKALDIYMRQLRIYGSSGDRRGGATTELNIGALLDMQELIPEAMAHYQRALGYFEGTGDKRQTANALHNIGSLYKRGDLNSQGSGLALALDHYQRALALYQEIGESAGIASTVHNLGTIFQRQGDTQQALDHLNRALKIWEEVGDDQGISSTKRNIGEIYNQQQDHRTAITWCEESLRLTEATGSLAGRKEACSCLYHAWKGLGNGNRALEYHEQMLVLQDSLKNDETAKKLQQMEFAQTMLQDSIARAEEARLVRETHAAEVHRKDRTRNTLLGGGFMILLLAGGLWSRLRYIRRAKAVIEREKDRSESLLLNILPAEIAAELKEKGRADARDFDMVSILFTDFKDFTEASARLGAKELVAEINTCFEAFDRIMGEYGIEKIKTIGDAYMAAGGLPVPTAGSVKNTVLAALEMQAFIARRERENEAAGRPAFEMRVGIHTGPVVAGIVGVKKFAYDIWGDTVNTASRMESCGEVGMVNISRATYDLVKDEPDLHFIARGMASIKGKGDMEMFFVDKVSEQKLREEVMM
jgi:adenylate cyclase